MEPWLQLLQTFGLAVVILFAIGIAAWKIVRWAGLELIIPLRDKGLTKFVAFLERIEATVGKLDANVDSVTSNLSQQTASLKGLQDTTSKVLNSSERTATSIEEEHGNVIQALEGSTASAETRQTILLAELKETKALVAEARVEIKELRMALGK